MHRPHKAVDREAKWYYLRPKGYGAPPLRPSDEEKIFGCSKAERKKTELEARWGEEYVIHETTAPPRRRREVGPSEAKSEENAEGMYRVGSNVATKNLLTVEDFMRLPDSVGDCDVRYEIVEGELITVSPGMRPHNLVRDKFLIVLRPFR